MLNSGFIKCLFLILFASICLDSVFAQTDVNRGFAVSIGDIVNDAPLHFQNGDSLMLSDYLGKVVVLQFTASWCSVCRKEMPHLENEVWLPYKNKDFVLIGVDIDKDVSKIAPFIEDMEVTYPIAIDNDQSLFYNFAEKGAGVTRNIVIDQKGKIVFLTRLFDPIEFQAMINKIDELLP